MSDLSKYSNKPWYRRSRQKRRLLSTATITRLPYQGFETFRLETPLSLETPMAERELFVLQWDTKYIKIIIKQQTLKSIHNFVVWEPHDVKNQSKLKTDKIKLTGIFIEIIEAVFASLFPVLVISIQAYERSGRPSGQYIVCYCSVRAVSDNLGTLVA